MEQIIEDMYRLRNSLLDLHKAGVNMNELRAQKAFAFEVDCYLEAEGLI